jgi:outer membrane protein
MKSSSFKAGIVKFAAVAAVMLAAAAGAQAQELKIGYVNSDRVLREATLAKAAQSRLETEFSKRQKEGEDAAVKLKAAADKLDKDSPTLSEAERSRRQRELVDQDRELQRKRREFQEDLNQRKNEELASVIERANKVVKQIYDTEKFDVILTGDAVILASARVDITDKVIKSLNAQGAAAK